MFLPKILCVLLPVFTSTDVVGGYLLTRQCIAPLPCFCNKISVECDSAQLSHVPSFTLHKEMPFLLVNIGWNHIATIPADSFKSLSKVTEIYIDLQHNGLNQIDPHAFSGIQAALTRLYLQTNKLTYLPSGLNELTFLAVLNIEGNPLTSLDATTMSKLGLTLQSFAVSVDQLPAFPTELHILKHFRLKHLVVNNIPSSGLNSDAFQGLESTLIELEMSKSKLEKIPAAICPLKALQKLTFSQSQNLTKNDFIFESCNDSIHALNSLILVDNHLSTFPNVFNLFPHLYSLSLKWNYLQMIENSSVQYNSTLSHLDLSGNRLNRIPDAINKLTNMTDLYFRYNNILSIEDSDLMQLTKLEYLDLRNNPLSYVSPNAFKHNLLLLTVDFDNTMLTRLPLALVGLPNLRSISISSESIDCSCSAMAYLKSWNVNTIDFRGNNCSTGEFLKTYLTSALPNCP